MPGYTFDNTICTFTHNKAVIDAVKIVATERNMDVHEAKDEVDLVGVPYWLAVVDATLINDIFIDYMEELWISACKGEHVIDEKLISHTSTDKLPDWFAELFIRMDTFSTESFRDKCRVLYTKG